MNDSFKELKRIRKTSCKNLIEKSIRQTLSSREQATLLSIAVILLNSEEEVLQDYGYRIVLQYSNRTKDYLPLFEVALNYGYIPIAHVLEKELYKNRENALNSEINGAYAECFHSNGIYYTEQQTEMQEAFSFRGLSDMAIVAPTSYGKTELLISAFSDPNLKNICVITPTKSLLNQTKQRLAKARIPSVKKIIVHPDMYNPDERITAVLTQERLLRLMKNNPSIHFDCVIIDEAHNLLENDSRQRLLASVLVLIKSRNQDTIFRYLSPFLNSGSSLELRFIDSKITDYHVSEKMKSERLFSFDPDEDSQLSFYDQYLDTFFSLKNNHQNYMEFIIGKASKKNIVYYNKPTDIEAFALDLASSLPIIDNPTIQSFCTNLASYVHSDYKLIDCAKRGVLYHHGSTPIQIRQFVESAFSSIETFQYIITSSTLLEGVNLPADTMFICSPSRGRKHLTAASFKNLIGRVCRFNEIFTGNPSNLTKLEPNIYVIRSPYWPKRTKPKDFLRSRAHIDLTSRDDIRNVALKNSSVSEADESLTQLQEHLENLNPGTISNYSGRKIKTIAGEFCIVNNVTEFDVFQHETRIDKHINDFIAKTQGQIDNCSDLLEILYHAFFSLSDDGSLSRFSHEKTRSFYEMFLDWRLANEPFHLMIQSFFKYWKRIQANPHEESLVYAGRWGEECREGYKPSWVDVRKKSDKQLINLAIVRIKEEQDFLDHSIMKFVEVLHDLNVLDEHFYLNIKYGTTDKTRILLIKNGYSLSLANLLCTRYVSHVAADTFKSVLQVNPMVIEEMINNRENDILIYEATMQIPYSLLPE